MLEMETARSRARDRGGGGAGGGGGVGVGMVEASFSRLLLHDSCARRSRYPPKEELARGLAYHML